MSTQKVKARSLKEFKEKHLFSKRQAESARIQAKFPDRIPVVVFRLPSCKELEMVERTKYLLPEDMTVGMFISYLRKQIPELPPEKALFVFINNILSPNSFTLRQLYEDQSDMAVSYTHLTLPTKA